MHTGLPDPEVCYALFSDRRRAIAAWWVTVDRDNLLRVLVVLIVLMMQCLETLGIICTRSPG